MESIMEMLKNPIIAGLVGLVIGLSIAAIVKINAIFSRQSLVRENGLLIRNHLLMHDTGSKTLNTELEVLKRQNENLRITVAALKTKTEKTEVLTLHCYDKAIRLMNVRAPGFAQAWESTLSEVETEMLQIDTGVVAWIRKAIRPSLASKSNHASLQPTNKTPSAHLSETPAGKSDFNL